MKNETMSKAKAQLILDQPFFASLLLPMPMILDNSISTMATNGEQIRYSEAFVKTLTVPETIFVLAHETLHCVFEHMFRRGDRDHNGFNIAADYVINDYLIKERIGTMPKVGLHDPQLVIEGGGTAEGVYEILLKNQQKKQKGKGKGKGGGQGNGPSFPQPGEDGGALDSLEAPSKDPSVNNAKAAEMRVRVIQAKNAAKMAGKLSAGLERLVNDLTKVETDWKTILRRFLSERAKVELTFARPKRRFLAEDLYLPSQSGERLGKIVVAVDCSGSVDDKTLRVMGSELKAIFEDVHPAEVKVIYFDHDVCHVETFTGEDEVKLSPHGGGGTAFSPIFKEIAKDEETPVACVVLTDMCCSDFGNTPDYPVLWASTEDVHEQPPFGDVIRVRNV